MSPAIDPPDRTDPRTGMESGRSGLWMGILAFRFASCIWMIFLVSTTRGYERPYLAWGLVGVTVSWTLFLTVTRSWWKPAALWIDLFISFSFVLLSGSALEHGGVVSTHPFFADAYPASTALMWGAAFGTLGGLASAIVLCGALALSRPVNGIGLAGMNGNQLQAFLSGCVYYVAAGVAAGLVARLVDRSGDQVRLVIAEAMRERERAARLAERESIGRAIHDSVLQSLALVHKRGRELAQQPSVSADEVRDLADTAGRQEEVLRALILREPEEPPNGMASLRAAVEREAARVDQIHPDGQRDGTDLAPRGQGGRGVLRGPPGARERDAARGRLQRHRLRRGGRRHHRRRDPRRRRGLRVRRARVALRGQARHPAEHEGAHRGARRQPGRSHRARPRDRGGVPTPRRESSPVSAARNEGDPIRVMVVDDHPVWRDGVKGDLERSGAATVVAEASDGGEAIEQAREAMPDLILMDLRMPGVSGVDAIRQIVEESPHVKVLVLSASAEESDVLEAVKVGAAGYILKSATSEELVEAVRRVRRGDPVFTAPLAGLVLSEFRRVSMANSGEPALTTRENEILKLVAKGYTYREIAEQLFISVKTVQNHVQNILAKLQLRRRYELMRYAIQRGLDKAP
jgi:DNA-binding NarL/FixJ family response regulator/signal transduction histidine kinase